MASTEERIIRVLRPSVIVLCGPAACGKSTFAVRHFRPTHIISSDFCRKLVCDVEEDQRYHPQTFALVDFLVGQRLSINRLCVVDSTALTFGARRSLLDLGRKYRVRTELFLFDVSLEKCLERDVARQRSVGRRSIEEQYRLFMRAKTSIPSEGFTQVVELHEEDLNNVKIEILYRPINPIDGSTTAKNRHQSKIPPQDHGPGC
jgi:predicted kinase